MRLCVLAATASAGVVATAALERVVVDLPVVDLLAGGAATAAGLRSSRAEQDVDRGVALALRLAALGHDDPSVQRIVLLHALTGCQFYDINIHFLYSQ